VEYLLSDSMWEVMLILTGVVLLCFILFELLNRYIIYVIADYNNYIWSTVYWANEESSGSPKNWDGRNLWWTQLKNKVSKPKIK
jgi:hypothetical protein